VDGQNLESDDRLHEGQFWLQKLLRRSAYETFLKPFSQRLCLYSPSGKAKSTATLAIGKPHLRQFHERPVS
jgi:hypothetical protein